MDLKCIFNLYFLSSGCNFHFLKFIIAFFDELSFLYSVNLAISARSSLSCEEPLSPAPPSVHPELTFPGTSCVDLSKSVAISNFFNRSAANCLEQGWRREDIWDNWLRRGVQASHSHFAHCCLRYATRYCRALQKRLVLWRTLCPGRWRSSWNRQMDGSVWRTLKNRKIVIS